MGKVSGKEFLYGISIRPLDHRDCLGREPFPGIFELFWPPNLHPFSRCLYTGLGDWWPLFCRFCTLPVFQCFCNLGRWFTVLAGLQYWPVYSIGRFTVLVAGWYTRRWLVYSSLVGILVAGWYTRRWFCVYFSVSDKWPPLLNGIFEVHWTPVFGLSWAIRCFKCV
jgi:hypothetical protein